MLPRGDLRDDCDKRLSIFMNKEEEPERERGGGGVTADSNNNFVFENGYVRAASDLVTLFLTCFLFFSLDWSSSALTKTASIC